MWPPQAGKSRHVSDACVRKRTVLQKKAELAPRYAFDASDPRRTSDVAAAGGQITARVGRLRPELRPELKSYLSL